jgi:hypothetical protein
MRWWRHRQIHIDLPGSKCRNTGISSLCQPARHMGVTSTCPLTRVRLTSTCYALWHCFLIGVARISSDGSRRTPVSTPHPPEERRYSGNVPSDNLCERRPSRMGAAKLWAFKKGCGTASIDVASKCDIIEEIISKSRRARGVAEPMRMVRHHAERLHVRRYIRKKQYEMQVTPIGRSLLGSSSISLNHIFGVCFFETYLFYSTAPFCHTVASCLISYYPPWAHSLSHLI